MRKSNRRWWPRISVLFLAVISACVVLSSPGFSKPAKHGARPKGNTTHAYLLRGLFNVFSTGMDGIREKLNKRGIEASVDNHALWPFLADEAIKDYKAGRVRTIMIMGHSQGAINAVDMANKIGEAGVPVSLVVTFDPAFRNTVTSSNVKWVVNLYMPDGIGSKIYKGPGYTGRIDNVDLDKKPVHHMTLDKIGFVQDMAIGYAVRAAKGGAREEPDSGSARAKVRRPSARATQRQ